jgi:putative DNA methylase
VSGRRLIEQELPLAEINAASAHEKSLRHGHISTLHLWWARRPLSMSRAIVFGTLLPAPETEDGRSAALKALADAAPFGATSDAHLIGTLRQLLGTDENGSAPRVLDCFAGGGAIPLEAARLGCNVTAFDLNPVAHLIERATLEFPQRFGQPDSHGANPLADDFLYWSDWIATRARQAVSPLFPRDDSDREQAVYFWCRTMPCPNPSCGIEIPLMSSFYLAKSTRRNVWVDLDVTVPVRPAISIVNGKPPDVQAATAGTVKASSVTCPNCHASVPAKEVRAWAKSQGLGVRLYAVMEVQGNSRTYRAPTANEENAAINLAGEALASLEHEETEFASTIPDEDVDAIGYINLQNLVYGYARWRDLFGARQLVVLATCAELVREAHATMVAEGMKEDRARAIATYLAFLVDKMADYDSSFTSWATSGEFSRSTFPRQAIAMTWDFVEAYPFHRAKGIWAGHTRWIELAIRHCSDATPTPVTVVRGNSQDMPFDDEQFDAVIIDPPYYYSVMFSDLSDFFYVWLKRSVGHLYPDMFTSQWTPKSQEVIQNRTNPRDARYISGEEFEERLRRSLAEIARVTKADGVVTIVFAHTDVVAWERLLRGLQSVGLVVTTSWPMRSERGDRPLAQVKAALGSSIVLTCRKREGERVGFYDDVVRDLEVRIAERLGAFNDMGLVGADYFASAVGPAFEAFAQYASITKLSGETVDVSELMLLARQAVARRAMRQLLGDISLNALDDESLFYLTWRWAYLTADVPADEAYKLARAFDVDMSDLIGQGGLVERHGATFRLLGPNERRDLDLSVSPSLIDVLHLACQLWDASRRPDLADLLGATGMGGEPAFWSVARVLGEVLPSDSTERRMLLGIGGNRDVIEHAAANSTATFEELTLFNAG